MWPVVGRGRGRRLRRGTERGAAPDRSSPRPAHSSWPPRGSRAGRPGRSRAGEGEGQPAIVREDCGRSRARRTTGTYRPRTARCARRHQSPAARRRPGRSLWSRAPTRPARRGCDRDHRPTVACPSGSPEIDARRITDPRRADWLTPAVLSISPSFAETYRPHLQSATPATPRCTRAFGGSAPSAAVARCPRLWDSLAGPAAGIRRLSGAVSGR